MVLLGISLPNISIHKKALKTVATLNTWLLQSCAKFFWEKFRNEGKLHKTERLLYLLLGIIWAQAPKICFSRGNWALGCVPSSFEIFLIFLYFLRSWIASPLATRVTLDTNFRFTCGERKLYYKFVKFPNIMTRIAGWVKIILATTATTILQELIKSDNSDIHSYQVLSCKYKINSESKLGFLIFAYTKISTLFTWFRIELKNGTGNHGHLNFWRNINILTVVATMTTILGFITQAPSKKICFDCLNQWKPFKMIIKNLLHLKSFFCSQIFRFLSWPFGHVEKTNWLER